MILTKRGHEMKTSTTFNYGKTPTFKLDILFTEFCKQKGIKKFTRQDLYSYGVQMGFTLSQCETVFNNQMSFKIK